MRLQDAKLRTGLLAALAVLLPLAAFGCVRRTARFTSDPPGARVFVNDEEIGRTPATIDFTWYGDYDVIYRLEGYQTVKTHAEVNPPIYQRFPLDFFAEVLWPGELHDHHDIATEKLTKAELPSETELIQRAMDFRDRALFEDLTDAETTGRQ